MRIDRFQAFVPETLAQAPEVATAEPWQEDGRPYGVVVTLPSGARVWVGLSTSLAEGGEVLRG